MLQVGSVRSGSLAAVGARARHASGRCRASDAAVLVARRCLSYRGRLRARELARPPLDAEAALAAYETERRWRTARIQLAARAQGEIFHLQSPLARLKRVLRLDRFEKPKADLLSKDWIYSYDPIASYQ